MKHTENFGRRRTKEFPVLLNADFLFKFMTWMCSETKEHFINDDLVFLLGQSMMSNFDKNYEDVIDCVNRFVILLKKNTLMQSCFFSGINKEQLKTYWSMPQLHSSDPTDVSDWKPSVRRHLVSNPDSLANWVSGETNKKRLKDIKNKKKRELLYHILSSDDKIDYMFNNNNLSYIEKYNFTHDEEFLNFTLIIDGEKALELSTNGWCYNVKEDTYSLWSYQQYANWMKPHMSFYKMNERFDQLDKHVSEKLAALFHQAKGSDYIMDFEYTGKVVILSDNNIHEQYSLYNLVEKTTLGDYYEMTTNIGGKITNRDYYVPTFDISSGVTTYSRLAD